MKSLFSNWSWKGFFVRYLLILALLLAANYMFKNTDASQTDELNHVHSVKPSMSVDHKIVGSELHLTFTLTNFELSLENVNKDKVENQGHIHLYVDGEKVAKIYDTEYVVKDLTPGSHELRLELAHNDHDSVGIDETIKITIPSKK